MPKELVPTKEYGFTKESFTTYLISVGFLKRNEKIISWNINERDYLSFDVGNKKNENIT